VVRRLVAALPFLLLLAARPVVADEYRASSGYLGARVSSLFVVNEAALDAGFRPLSDLGWLWIHAEVVTGGIIAGDRSEDTYRAALGGLELRTPRRGLRGVLGMDLGVARMKHYSEDELLESELESVYSWHLGGEAPIGRAAFRFGLTGNVKEPQAPMLTLGLSLGFD
jgi:hypothetical protein